MDTSSTQAPTTPTPASAPAGEQIPSLENPALGPMPKNPFARRWWQLPKMFYIILIAVIVLSLGSSAYLLFAPSVGNRPGSSTQANGTGGPLYGPAATIIPSPTSGVILVGTPTPLPGDSGSPTPTPDLTVGWRVYNNYAYKYTFRYPQDWGVTDIGNLEPKIPSYITINPLSIDTPTTNLGITISSSFRTFEEEQNLRSAARSIIIINGQTASRTEEKNSDGSISIDIVVKGTSFTYILVGKKTYESTFNLLYPTFKLL